MTVYTVIFTLYGYFRAEAGLVSAFLFVKFRFVGESRPAQLGVSMRLWSSQPFGVQITWLKYF